MLSKWIHRLKTIRRSIDAVSEVTSGDTACLRLATLPSDKPLLSPLTQSPCVFYSLTLKEWINGQQHPFLSHRSSRIFAAKDASGHISIDPAEVQSTLIETKKQGHSSDFLGEIRTLAKRLPFELVDEYGELRSLSFTEHIVHPGETIIAIGSVHLEADPNGVATYREQPTRVVLKPTRIESLV